MAGSTRPLEVKRRFSAVAAFAATGLALLLAGCGGSTTSTGLFDRPSGQPIAQGPGPVTPGGDTLGQGSVKVAMILPMSAGGASSQVAQQLRNAADLALRDFQGANVQILIKDDAGTTEGGQAAASQAIGEGASLIIGPLNAVAARGAAGPARQAGIPVVTFTTDTSVATRGVYLIGFLPSTDVERIVSYAAAKGRRSMAAIVPDDAFGLVTEAAFRQAAAQAGVRAFAIERYKADPNDMQAKAQAIAKLGGQIDAVFVPDAAGNAAQIVSAMAAAGLDKNKVKILGTGRWNEPTAFAAPALAGAWFPAADATGIDDFKRRYRAAFNSDPGSLGVLGYEAVFLAAGLERKAGPQPFRDEIMLSRSGFIGKTGLFRFKADGTSERGLAVYEIGAGGAKVIDPAPQQFARGA